MSERAALLALGGFSPAERNVLEEAAAAAMLSLHVTASPTEASAWLDGHDPTALLLDTRGQASSLALETRAHARYRALPILALTSDPSELEFVNAFSWGADDIVPLDRAWSLTTRLRAVARRPAQIEVPPRGTALVAELDRSRRVATARVLSNAGFEVHFAVTATDARAFALEPDVTLAVCSTELVPDPLGLLEESRSLGRSSRFVVSAEPKRFADLTKTLGGRTDTRVTDASAPPENVIFLANELAAAHLADKRAAVRHLYGTNVWYRPEGLEEDELGFSYNASVGGLYVRTLSPPTEDRIWLELTPPHTARRVRLVGEVAWRRPFGPNGQATVPPGFGIRIVDGARSDVERWQLAFTPPPVSVPLG